MASALPKDIPGVISYKTASQNQSIPGVISYSSTMPNLRSTQNAQSPQTTTSTSQGSAQGGLMGQFNQLLNERKGIQNDKMNLQEDQLQKINTQKNNTAFQNAFASRSNLVDIMRKLLETSRQTVAAQSRVFM